MLSCSPLYHSLDISSHVLEDHGYPECFIHQLQLGLHRGSKDFVTISDLCSHAVSAQTNFY